MDILSKRLKADTSHANTRPILASKTTAVDQSTGPGPRDHPWASTTS